VLILDCCFSGRAIEAMADPVSVVSGQVEIAGTYTLTSTSANAPAYAPNGGRYTAFTAALLDLLNFGVPDGPDMLTLGVIYQQLLRTLTATGRPRPERRGTQTSDLLALARNRAGMWADERAMDEAKSWELRGLDLARAGDRVGAERWLRRAAEAGLANAMNNLGIHLVQQAPDEAEHWFRAAADTGDAQGLSVVT
jgi:TPR repeat protein